MAKKITEVLGKTIRKERKERNLTQQDLADKTGISRRHVADIESGQIDASFDVVPTYVLLATNFTLLIYIPNK